MLDMNRLKFWIARTQFYKTQSTREKSELRDMPNSNRLAARFLNKCANGTGNQESNQEFTAHPRPQPIAWQSMFMRVLFGIIHTMLLKCHQFSISHPFLLFNFLPSMDNFSDVTDVFNGLSNVANSANGDGAELASQNNCPFQLEIFRVVLGEVCGNHLMKLWG